MDPDAAGFIALAAVSASAIATTFAGLLWAAVQDGRTQRLHRRGS